MANEIIIDACTSAASYSLVGTILCTYTKNGAGRTRVHARTTASMCRYPDKHKQREHGRCPPRDRKDFICSLEEWGADNSIHFRSNDPNGSYQMAFTIVVHIYL